LSAQLAVMQSQYFTQSAEAWTPEPPPVLVFPPAALVPPADVLPPDPAVPEPPPAFDVPPPAFDAPLVPIAPPEVAEPPPVFAPASVVVPAFFESDEHAGRAIKKTHERPRPS
jgi:hypothetical protein